MPRIRTIKPEFWDSPDMRGCSPWARLLFIALWQWADDHGRGTANVRELAAFAFPDEQDPTVPTEKELPSLLSEIRGRFGVVFYEVRGRRYYYLPTFDKHQRTERKAKSRHPAPEEGVEYDPDPTEQGERPGEVNDVGVTFDSEGTSVAVIGSSVLGTGEQGNRGKGTGEETNTLAALASRHRRDDDEAEDEAEAEADTPEPEHEPVEPTRLDVEQLCTRLRDRMVDNGCKSPTITAQWRTQARLLLDRDERDLDQALRLIDWCQQDEFWASNILSIPKFRKQYDKLLLKARAEHNRRQARVVSVKDERVAATLQAGGPGTAELFASAWGRPLVDPRQLPASRRQLSGSA